MEGIGLKYLLDMPSVYIKTYGCQMNELDSEPVGATTVALLKPR